jgi:predicted AAA+ superfamily ATPase
LLLHELQRRSTSPLNRTVTARELGYGSRQTFDLRLTRLVRSFAAIWCHQVDDAGVHVPGAQSKLYLVDPLIARLAPRSRAGLTNPDLSRLTESAVGVALAAAIERRQPGRWLAGDSIGYARTSRGEIDFAPVPLPTPTGATVSTTALESKWVAAGWRPESRAIEARYAGGVVATRDILDLHHVAWAVPAPIVSLLLA